jgi:hypothetical protein
VGAGTVRAFGFALPLGNAPPPGRRSWSPELSEVHQRSFASSPLVGTAFSTAKVGSILLYLLDSALSSTAELA